MDLDITVSEAAQSDIASILEIERESQPEPWTQNSFAEEIGRGRLFVARPADADPSSGAFRGEIAGYICFWCVQDEVQILNVAVKKALRRQGIARKLLCFAISTEQASAAKVAVLEARKSNAAARGLYESFGFRVTGERPGYYGAQSESAILMELDIEQKCPRGGVSHDFRTVSVGCADQEP